MLPSYAALFCIVPFCLKLNDDDDDDDAATDNNSNSSSADIFELTSHTLIQIDSDSPAKILK